MDTQTLRPGAHVRDIAAAANHDPELVRQLCAALAAGYPVAVEPPLPAGIDANDQLRFGDLA